MTRKAFLLAGLLFSLPGSAAPRFPLTPSTAPIVEPGALISLAGCFCPSDAFLFAPGPLDFDAYSTAALQEGKYVWAWMPRLDQGCGRGF